MSEESVEASEVGPAPRAGLTRRKVVQGAAWSLPVIAAAIATPLAAASVETPQANIQVTSACFAGTTALGSQIGPTWVMKETNGVNAGTVPLVEKLTFTFTSLSPGLIGFGQIQAAILPIATWIAVQSVGAVLALPWVMTNGSTLIVPPINLDANNIVTALVPTQSADGTWKVSYTLTRNVTWNNVAASSEARYSYPLNITPPLILGVNLTQGWTLTSGLADAVSTDNTANINTAFLGSCV